MNEAARNSLRRIVGSLIAEKPEIKFVKRVKLIVETGGESFLIRFFVILKMHDVKIGRCRSSGNNNSIRRAKTCYIWLNGRIDKSGRIAGGNKSRIGRSGGCEFKRGGGFDEI